MLCFFSFLILVVVAADHFIKFLIKTHIKNASDIIFWKIFKLTYIENDGAAFGLFSGSRWFFIIVTILIVGYLFYLVFFRKINNKTLIIACALIIGGGVGNLIDRISFGYVVDYIKFAIFPPVCNLADACIVVGVVIFIFHTFFVSKK